MIQNVKQSDSRVNPVSTDVIQVLCAADENYAKSLCVTLRTAAESLRAECRLKVFLIDGGIREDSWGKLRQSLAEFDVEINVIEPSANRLESLQELSTSHHITHTAYYRLLAAEWLPDDVSKVIYLDSDLLIIGDLAELWELEECDYYCWAVPDVACPFVDAKAANYNYKKSSPYLAVLSPIRNYRALGLEGSEPYFNSGIMVMHLDRWRADNISQKLLNCLAENQRHVWCWDQYALNVVFSGRWGQLPLKWNQGAHAFEFPAIENAPIAKEQFAEMIERPAVIHYTTEWKPWDPITAHPEREMFFEKLDQTAWENWRPTPAKFSLRKKWDRFALAVIKTWIVNYRKLAARFHK